MAEAKTVHASIPATHTVLYRDVITLLGNVANKWDAIVALFIVGGVVDKEQKAIVAAEFNTVYVSEKAPDAVDGSDDYKAAKKDATAMFGMGVKRALVRAGLATATKRKPKAATASGGETEGEGSQNTGDAPTTPELPPSIVARISDAMSRAGNLQTAFIKFQAAHKLPKAATEACGNMAEDIGKLFTELTALHAELNK